MFSYTEQPLPFAPEDIDGKISKDTLTIHHDKLYVGYVNKTKEIEEKLSTIDLSTANQVYSQYRGLKASEAFARNGVTLHESYFSTLGGTEILDKESAFSQQLLKDFGSLENFKAHLVATGMSVRGWAVCAWDTTDQKLHIYGCDAHDQGGIWGAFPLLTLDVYEHAYFIDFGSDRKSYIEDFWNNINWKKCAENFEKIAALQI